MVLLVAFAVLAYVGAFMYPAAHWHRGFLGGTIYIAVMIPFLVWLFYSPHRQFLIRILSSGLLLCAVIAWFGFVDQRHFLHNQLMPDPGSSAAGLRHPAQALLLHGRDPYGADANHTPISPGPGWILLWSPITLPLWTGLLSDITLAVTSWLIYRRHRLAAGVFVLLLMLLPLYHRMASSGMDLYAIALSFAALGIAMDNASDSPGQTALLAFLGGALATARLPMLLPLLMLGFGLMRKNERTGRIFLAVLVVTAMAWHGTFAAIAYHAGHWYQPLHVMDRAALSGTWNRVTPVVLGMGCLIWGYRRLNADLRTWLIGAFLMMMVLVAPTGISEGFHDRSWEWEGAGYICFPVPLLLAAIALYIRRQPGQGTGLAEDPRGLVERSDMRYLNR